MVYILLTKAKVPIYLGSSFAYITTIQAIKLAHPVEGNGMVLTGILIVGLIHILISIIVKYAGTKWLYKIFPPVVIGPMIMIIGFSLAATSMEQIGILKGMTNPGTYKEILVALSSFSIVVLILFKGKGLLKIIPFLIGILGGYLVAVAFRIVDFSSLSEVIKNPSQWFKVPDFMFIWFKDSSKEILNGTVISTYKLNLAAAITIAPLALVTAVEHIGDHSVLSNIVGQDFLTDPGLDKTLMGQGLATFIAASIGGPANTSYGENTSVVGMTKVASVWVTGLAAVIVMVLSFINIFVQLITSIPSSVLGGISIVLYGFVGLNGFKVLVNEKVDLNETKNLIIISTMMILGLGNPLIKVNFFDLNGILLAAFFGIILNLIIPDEKEDKNEDAVNEESNS